MIERQRYTIYDSLTRKQFFFSTRHMQRMDSKVPIPDDFVAISFSLPTRCVARPSLPDGLIDTIEKYLMIFHSGQTEIRNPDPAYTPWFRIEPVLK